MTSEKLLDKKWNSLSDLKRAIESNMLKGEQVVSFNGYKLITNKYEYGLAMGKLSRTPVK